MLDVMHENSIPQTKLQRFLIHKYPVTYFKETERWIKHFNDYIEKSISL